MTCRDRIGYQPAEVFLEVISVSVPSGYLRITFSLLVLVGKRRIAMRRW
jgi:hypothetical protein